MKQVIQDFRSGQLLVEEVPPPALQPGGVLVRNAYSAVSAGTERMLVEMAQRSLVGKARQRPDLVKLVLDRVRREGIFHTIELVRSRLDRATALGYSSAGIALEVGEGVKGIAQGDPVACGGGGYATHSEIVFVPQNLCVRVPDGVGLDEAAYATLGAIALQGVRVAEVCLGEGVAVIGLGLVGQLTVQILKAAGCRVLGVDLDEEKVRLALELGADTGVISGKEAVEPVAQAFSAGVGVDAVIITAATTSSQPVDLAGAISRDKGRVVVVEAVGMDIPRNSYYNKELDLRLSRAYGPGRYDPTYEEKGVDYPIGYVRWTERRNMEEFLRLVALKKVNVRRLVTHQFPVSDAPAAYELITGKRQEKYLGILLSYPEEGQAPPSKRVALEKMVVSPGQAAQELRVGVIGAGNFARGVLLPAMKKVPDIKLAGIATATGTSAKQVGQRFGFGYCTADYRQIMKDDSIRVVFILTRHNLHAPLVIQALERGKEVFVEKPLALNLEELGQVVQAWRQSRGRVMVGFNRRFSPSIKMAKDFLAGKSEPLIINYRVNAGYIPLTSWVHDPQEGGGRIIGEVCHFVDLIQFLAGANPVKVYAEAIPDPGKSLEACDTLVVTLRLSDGSVGTISYVANGDKSFPKERIEVFGNGSVCVIDDFQSLSLTRSGKTQAYKRSQDKGHLEELRAFAAALKERADVPIPFPEAVRATLATIKILDSLRRGSPVEIDEAEVMGSGE